MKLLILTHAEIEQLLPMRACIEVMAEALIVLARTHLAAMACVREIRRARIVSRTSEHARQLVAEMQPQFSFPVEAVASVEAAVRDADLIVTATSAHEPVLRREWIAAGAHIN